MTKTISYRLVNKVLIFVVIFSIGLGFGSRFLNKNQNQNFIAAEKNTPRSFTAEVYDKILENYWDNLSEAQLLDLFKLSIDKNGSSSEVAKFDNKDQLLTAIAKISKEMDEDKRNKFFPQVIETVLASLNPPGRSGLYTQKLEEQLKNNVQNINPEKDLYKDLGVSKEASPQAVAKAYQKKQEELSQDKSAGAAEKLKEISYAKEVLTKPDTKARYDQNKIEPTFFAKVVKPQVLYMQFKKFSPTSYDEFIKAFDTYKDDLSLNSLIFDLRGNIGGAVDATAYFLGHFIGKNQYAFDFYHKGQYLPFKTPTDKLPSVIKYKQIVILVDNQTQSSAELMAATFKKYHVGVVVGTPTKGWGTVEKVYQLDNQFDKGNKYSLFLVHSITLRDDNQPIEGRGVEPDINIKTDWAQQLLSYYRNGQLIEAVSEVLQK